MTRQEAHKFIKLYRKFAESGLKITDYAEEGVELQYPNGDKKWFTKDWYAAKSIEASV